MKKSRGTKNYTLRSKCLAVIEVQHSVKNFYVKLQSGAVALGAGRSPCVSWPKHDGPLAAWAKAKAMAGVTGAWVSI